MAVCGRNDYVTGEPCVLPAGHLEWHNTEGAQIVFAIGYGPCTGKDDDGCADVELLGRCSACGYVTHDIPRDSDEAHSELCCGHAGDCMEPATCDTHREPEHAFGRNQ